jgi:hypothetical protein
LLQDSFPKRSKARLQPFWKPGWPAQDIDGELELDPLIGSTLDGRYRVLRVLGEGGMGSVFLGEQKLGGTYGIISIHGLTILGWHMEKQSDWLIPSLGLAVLVGAACWRIGESAGN